MNIPKKNTNYDPQYWSTLSIYQQVITGLIHRLPEAKPNGVDRIFKLMQKRMVEIINSLHVLERVAEHEHYRDSAVLLRTAYDLHIQFLYILTDPVNLSVLYNNFQAVELHNVLKVFEDNPSSVVTQGLTSRPDYHIVRRKLLHEFDKYKPAYEYQKRGKTTVRGHWHEGQLDVLAKKVGREPEYRIMQKMLSAIVHSSSVSLYKDLLPEHAAYLDAYRLYGRIVGGIAIYLKVPLTVNEQTIYDQSLESLT